MRDALQRVVDADRPLICPVAKTIANQHVAADAIVEADTPADAIDERQTAIAATTAIDRRIELLAGAVAREHQAAIDQWPHGLTIDSAAIALAALARSGAERVGRKNVRAKPQPVEIVEQ